jgi:hypothetical protein
VKQLRGSAAWVLQPSSETAAKIANMSREPLLMWLASVIVRLAGLSGLGACSRDVPLVVVHCWSGPELTGALLEWKIALPEWQGWFECCFVC